MTTSERTVRPSHSRALDPVQRLRFKLAGEARWQRREWYFLSRIIPVLALWAAVVALVSDMLGVNLSSDVGLGWSLGIYFAGTLGLIIGLRCRAQRLR